MKVLYLTARLPFPPDRGDRLTAWSVLTALRARGHEVTLASFRDGTEAAGTDTALASLCQRVELVSLPREKSWLQAWLGLVSPTPSQVSYYRSADMRERVAELAVRGRPDVVFVQMFRVAPAVDHLTHPVKLLYLGDSLAMNLERSRGFAPFWRRPALAWEGARVARYEVDVTRRFRESWVVSPVDRDVLAARGAQRLRLVSHGVDPTLFNLVPSVSTSPRIVFVGNLSVPHNADAAIVAAREVLPRVRARVPAAELWLVGADPRPVVRALSTLPGVHVTGTVTDLRPHWATARMLLAPVRFSSGIQNKVLEAMASGVPVVTTPAVADATDGRDGVLQRVGADAAELAEASIALLADPTAGLAMAARAKAWVREHCSWDAFVGEMERAFEASRREERSA